MRIFLAINPPADVRRGIWDATAALRESSPAVAWVAEPKVHLTLKFIGDVPEEGVAQLSAAMADLARTHVAPVVRLGSVGAFPTFRRPRVIWMGIDPVGSSRVDLQACKLEYSIVSPK